LDNLAKRLYVKECGGCIPATSSRVFGYTEGIARFEPQEFQNCPYECGSVKRSRLVSWNPLGRKRRIRRGAGKRLYRPVLSFGRGLVRLAAVATSPVSDCVYQLGYRLLPALRSVARLLDEVHMPRGGNRCEDCTAVRITWIPTFFALGCSAHMWAAYSSSRKRRKLSFIS
jgi:hypothetical protein